jgi:chitodextrinase
MTATKRTFSLVAGATYHFRVCARDCAGNISRWSAVPTVTP